MAQSQPGFFGAFGQVIPSFAAHELLLGKAAQLHPADAVKASGLCVHIIDEVVAYAGVEGFLVVDAPRLVITHEPPAKNSQQ